VKICNQCALKEATTKVFRFTDFIAVCEDCKNKIEKWRNENENKKIES